MARQSRYAGTRNLNAQTKLAQAARVLLPRMYRDASPRWRQQAESMVFELVDVLGDPKVGDVDQISIDIVIDWLDEQEKAPATRDRWLSTFGKLLRELVDRKALAEAPKIPTQDKRAGKAKRIATLSGRELAQLDRVVAEECNAPDVAYAILILSTTGMRVGELMRLRERIERDGGPEGVVSVDRGGQAWVWLQETKNGTDREIPVPEGVREILRGTDLPSRRRLQKVWGEARALMGRRNDPHFVLHILRHTALTAMAQVMPIQDVQAIAGHSDIKTTMKYVHSNKQSLRRSFRAFETALEEGDKR